MNIYRKAADGSGEAVRVIESEDQQFLTSISSDGKLLAYAQSPPDAQSWDIWVLSLEPRGEPRLLVDEPGMAVVPAISPDGRWIAYLSIGLPEEPGAQASFQIFVRPVSGAEGRWQVTADGGVYPLWSTDGRELFYRDFSNNMVAVEVDTDPGSAFRMGRTTRLFEDPFAVRYDGVNQYDVAPDGQRFVMALEGEETHDEDLERIRLVFNWFTELERLFAEAGGGS